MSAPYPGYQPPAPKRLTRSRTDKFLGGVCGGVARYLNMDPTLVRVLWVVLSLITSGAGLIVYLVMLFVVPEEDAVPPPPVQGPVPGQQGGDVWGSGGAPWEQPTASETARKSDDPVSPA